MGDVVTGQYVPNQKERNFAKLIYLFTILPGDLMWGAFMMLGYAEGSKVMPKFVEFHFQQAKKYLFWAWPSLVLILVPFGLMMLISSLGLEILYSGVGLALIWLIIITISTFKAIGEAGAGRWTKIWPNK
jgi:hypothetical protein